MLTETARYLNEYDPLNGWQVEINVVHHCNLNCYGCNHFAPIAEPFFITLEEIERTFQHIHDNLPHLKRVMLLGGEPLLHPQIYDICKLIHTILPETHIDIFTNGKLLINKTSEYYIPFRDINTSFFITIYPYIDYSSILQPIKDVYGLDGFNSFVYRYHWTFSSTGVRNRPSDFVEQFYNCTAQRLPCTTIRDYNIYECPFAAMVDVYNKRFNKDIPISGLDRVSLFDIKDLSALRDFLVKPKPVCGYCKCGGEFFLWNESERSYDEFTLSPSERIRKDPSLEDKFFANKRLLDYSSSHTLFKGRRLIDMNDSHFCRSLIEQMNKRFDYNISYGKEPNTYVPEDFIF